MSNQDPKYLPSEGPKQQQIQYGPHNNTEDVSLNELFSIPIVIVNIGRKFTEEELYCLENIPIMKNPKREMKNHQSKNTYLFDKYGDKELKDIENFCEDHIERYLQKIEGVDTDIATVRITQSWLNKTKPQEHHHPHVHSNSYLSGVLYIKCLPDVENPAGKDHKDSIVFKNRLHGMFNCFDFPLKGHTKWTTQEIAIPVKDGDLIIFPSWIIHRVKVNKTDAERISLSFNTFPIGEMGESSNATHLKL